MTIYTENCNQGVQSGLFAMTALLFQRADQWLQLQHAKASLKRERQQLLGMSDQMLRDIGVTREQAVEEAAKHDVPAGRMPARI